MNCKSNLESWVTTFLIWGLLLSSLALCPWVQDPGILKAPLMCVFSFALIFKYSKSWSKIFVLFATAYFLEIIAGATHYVNSSESQLFALLGILSFFSGYFFESYQYWVTPILVFTFVIQLRGGWDFVFGQPWGGGISGNVTSFFVQKNIFGFLLTPILIFHLWLWPSRNTLTKTQTSLYYINIALLPILMVVTGSRGAQLGAFIGLLSFLLMRPEISVPSRIRWFVYVAILIFGIVVIQFIPEWQYRAISETFTTVNGEKPFRLWAWSADWKLIQDAPWFGHGIGSFRYLVVPFQEASLFKVVDPFMMLRNAHSHYLEVLADRGAMGLILEFGALFPALFFLFRAGRRQNFSAQCAFAALLALAIHSIFAEASEYPTSILTYWGLIGLGWRQASVPILNTVPIQYARPWNFFFWGGVSIYLAFQILSFTRYEYFDFLYVKAMKIQKSNPPEFSRRVNKILSEEPNHLETAYLFAVNLAEKGRFDLAKKQIQYVNSIAPNQKVPDMFLSTLYFKQGIFDSAYQYAAKVQKQYPFNLPTFEIMVQSASLLGRCSRVDSLKGFAKRKMFRPYSKPNVDTLTYQVLDRWYQQEPWLNELEKHFGGAKLKEKFESQYIYGYYKGLRDYNNLSNVMKFTCPLQNPLP